MLNHDSTYENRTEILRKVYQKVLTAAGHRHAKWWLAFVAFIESSIFLIPPDVMLIPMVLANRSQWWRLALTATIASVIGGLAGYAIGLFLYETIGNMVIGFYAYGNKFSEYMDIYKEWGGWAVFGAGLTPFPYKVITIASGRAETLPHIILIAVDDMLYDTPGSFGGKVASHNIKSDIHEVNLI